ncbi:MAG: hypothetical protein QOI33_2473 [Mycobacterium sp.]|jgi:hypothetical protein|nr:hypothetical protein [Mycobacterium sp.]
MYLSAERVAVADKAVQDTFEQSSVAWQAIPNWDTGDRGQLRVRSDYAYAPPPAPGNLADPLGGASLELGAAAVRFAVTVAQAIAPSPDALLAAVISRAVQLATIVDKTVIDVLRIGAQKEVTSATTDVGDLLNALIDARALLESLGYRAPSCLLTGTAGLKALNNLQNGFSDFQAILDAASINSLYRVDQLGADKRKLLLIGRRQRIPHGGAAATSAGEEPVDLAVSVPPSLEVVGETEKGIEMAVRIRFATRLTDDYGVVGVVTP